MQIFLICFFAISVICLVLGFRKSTFYRSAVPKQHCASCGWTTEKVKLCQLDLQHKAVVVPLCFDCSMKYEALPMRGRARGSNCTTCV